jgi:NADH:ubiquinone oxidoreductase subunit 3 (subunit A)
VSDGVLTSLPIVFIISLLVTLLLYWYGGRISPKVKSTVDKLAPYACGEEYPAQKLQVNVERFFIYAVFFLVFDILAFMLATSLGSPGIMPALYAGITLIAVIFLLPILKLRME